MSAHPIRPLGVARLGRLSLLCGALCACAPSVRTTPFDPLRREEPRRAVDEIRLYAGQRPSCPYTEIGRVSASRSVRTPWPKVVRAARVSAHDMGGDAIIGVTEDAMATHRDEDAVGHDAATELSGIVIRFRDADCMS